MLLYFLVEVFCNITIKHKKAGQRKINDLNRYAKNMVINLDLEGRIEKLEERESYITVKYHKEDFPYKISCWLIKPIKIRHW